jgi:hypothetical protein
MGKIGNAYNMLVGNLKGRDHSEDLGVDGKVSEWMSEIGWKVVDWIYLAQDRD